MIKNFKGYIYVIIGFVTIGIIVFALLKGGYSAEELRPYTISIDGIKLIPGQTKVQTLLDYGFQLGTSEQNTDKISSVFYPLEPTFQIKSNTRTNGFELWKEADKFAILEISNLEKTNISLSDGLVTVVELEKENLSNPKILLNNKPVSDLNAGNLSVLYSNLKTREQGTGYEIKNKSYKLEFYVMLGDIWSITSSYNPNR